MTACGVPCQILSKSLVGGEAGSTTGHIDWHSKADANKNALLAWVRQPGDDPDDLTIAVEQRAPGIAWVDGGVNLN